MPSVLITGTSAGIGKVTTVELAKRGWRVVASMRNLDKAGTLEAELTQAGTCGQVEIIQLDVTDPASIQTAVVKTLSLSDGTLDAVVHNAGASVAGAFEDLPDDAVRHVMETNFFGVLALTKALLPTFRAQRRGRILIVSSEVAFFGMPANSIYTASKWAIEGWAELLAYDVTPFGIDVILVEPGPHRTNIWESTQRLRPPDSPYSALLQQLYSAGDLHYAATAGDPVNVAVKIAHALEVRKPRFRYPVGPISNINHVLRGKIPTWLLRAMTTRYLGLHRIRV